MEEDAEKLFKQFLKEQYVAREACQKPRIRRFLENIGLDPNRANEMTFTYEKL